MTQSDPYKDKLSPEQYRIMREKGTEAPFTGEYVNHKEDGMYHCAACGAGLFSSENKFDSGSGWPSFDDIAKNENVNTKLDESHGMIRTEVLCAKCGSHLGHVFPDGPRETTGQRYCINSACLAFKKDGGE